MNISYVIFETHIRTHAVVLIFNPDHDSVLEFNSELLNARNNALDSTLNFYYELRLAEFFASNLENDPNLDNIRNLNKILSKLIFLENSADDAFAHAQAIDTDHILSSRLRRNHAIEIMEIFTLKLEEAQADVETLIEAQAQ